MQSNKITQMYPNWPYKDFPLYNDKYAFKRLFTPKTRVFFGCGNSAADISKPHTFKWGALADDVFPSANFTLPQKPRPPMGPI